MSLSHADGSEEPNGENAAEPTPPQEPNTVSAILDQVVTLVIAISIALAEKLGSDWDVVLHGEGANYHFHCELDPK